MIRILGDQDALASDDSAKAGWKLGTTVGSAATNGGAYGLWLCNYGSTIASSASVDGTLAAIFYLRDGGLALTGTMAGGTRAASGSQVLINSAGSESSPGYTFDMAVYDSGGTQTNTIRFNFDRNSRNYARKVFNTNATKTNTSLTDTSVSTGSNVVLGESFEKAISDKISGAKCYGVLMGLGGDREGNDFKFATRAARSGWFISQDLRATPANADPDENVLTPAYNPDNTAVINRLFKFHTLSTGQYEQRNFKISIENIRYSTNPENPYGSFDVVVRALSDSDNAPKVVERFNNCNLNPNSDRYIAVVIGDTYYEWDNDKKRLVEYGEHPNNSKIIRMEMASAVANSQVNAEALPFGAEGPIKRTGWKAYFHTGSQSGSIITASGSHGAAAKANSDSAPGMKATGSNVLNVVRTGAQFASFTGSTYSTDTTKSTLFWYGKAAAAADAGQGTWIANFTFPSTSLRSKPTDGNLSDPTLAYFGFTNSSGSTNTAFEASTVDILRPLPAAYSNFAPESLYSEKSWIFSLDDVSGSYAGVYQYESGSRGLGKSITAISGSYKSVLDLGFNRFTAPIFGGFDGFDITEAEPLNQSRALPSTATEAANSMYYSVKKGMDLLADPEYVETNLVAQPGIVNENLTQHILNICEDRGDALAIVDPRGGYLPSSENGNSEQSRISTNHVNEVVRNMERRSINSSYGAAYYPWVQIRDDIGGGTLYVPPSVPAIGAMAFSDKQKAVWFAPAGFNRGGLSNGAGGFPVVNVRSKLSSRERDDLYEASINPIASFPSEGIVIFGQKTLQTTPSALDRINVRRLMIFVKKEISNIAANLLFEQNVPETWDRFVSQVEPFLSSVRTGFGLSDFRVVLDETTTTPELVDRNIMYAKIFLKPTRAVEFIAIDFNITNTGASFDD